MRAPAGTAPVPTTQRHLDTSAAEGDGGDVRGLHTVATMAAVSGAPLAAVRHWIRTGSLRASRRAGTIGWFAYGELVVARRLARLLAAGFGLREIDARLAELHPGGTAAAARSGERIVVDGRRLHVQRGGTILGGGGQRLLGFYTDGVADEACAEAVIAPAGPWPARGDGAAHPPERDAPAADLLAMAADLEAAGELEAAAEALRALLQVAGPSATVSFMLAELLYRSGDLTAARERYYMAIEFEPDHLEARTSLACVLAELGDAELAEAALEGVLDAQPDYADAHWHLAGIMGRSGRPHDEDRHLRAFVAIAPDSPWARSARERLGER